MNEQKPEKKVKVKQTPPPVTTLYEKGVQLNVPFNDSVKQSPCDDASLEHQTQLRSASQTSLLATLKSVLQRTTQASDKANTPVN